MKEMPISSNICAPIATGEKRELHFSWPYPDKGTTFHIRPVTMEDVPILVPWLLKDFKNHPLMDSMLFEEFEEAYRNIAASTMSQSFMISANLKPTCVIDICSTLLAGDPLFQLSGQGDYVITVIKNPEDTYLLPCLQGTLKFMFQFPEVQRVFVETDRNDQHNQALFSLLGFRPFEAFHKNVHKETYYLSKSI